MIPPATPAPPAPTRRGLLARSTAALVTGAAAITVARAARLAAPVAAGDDAELIRLCAAFLAEDAVIQAWNADKVTWETGEAASKRWWGYIGEIEGMPAVTTEGLRTEAECSLRALEGVAEPECTADDLARDVLGQIAGKRARTDLASIEAMSQPDAELIALCERVVALEAKRDEIYVATEDDDEIDRQSGLLIPEFDEIRDRLYAIGAPTSEAGRRAFARAAIASAQNYKDGSVILDSGGLGSYLAFGLCHSMTERVA